MKINVICTVIIELYGIAGAINISLDVTFLCVTG